MRESPPLVAEEHLRQGAALARNDTYAESFPRWACDTNGAIAATGVGHATAIPLQAGDIVSTITFVTATTAAATPTAGFVALYSAAAVPALLGQSANFGATARAANTAFTVPLVEPVLIAAAGLYYISLSFTAGTIPTVRGTSTGHIALGGAVIPGAPALAVTHGTALGGVAPATIATPTAVATPAYYLVR